MSKEYVPSPEPTDKRLECQHHKARVDCDTCNPVRK